MTRVTQGLFSGGIMGEDMYSRTDTAKFKAGLKDAVNVTLRAQGGFENRAGLETVTACHVAGAGLSQWNIPFQFNTEQSYTLEFTEAVFRVIKDGAYVIDTSVAAQSVASVGDDRVTLESGEDPSLFPVGSLVFILDPNGSHAAHASVFMVASKAGDDILLTGPTGAALDTTDGDWGTLGAGATVELVYQQTNPYTLAEMPAVRFAQDADTMFLGHLNHPVKELTRTDHDDWTLTNTAFTPGMTAPANGAATATVGDDADLTDLETYTYVVASLNLDTDEESLPSAEFTVDNDLAFGGSINHLTFDAATDAGRYSVYREDAGAFGFVGTTTSTSFNDENITPDVSRGPKVGRNPFDAVGDYPSVVSFYEQRLAFAKTLNDPQLVEMSRVDNVRNFGTTFPSLSDDAFRFRVRAKEVNAIQAFVPHTSLGIFTTGGEWEIPGQGDGDYVRPDRRRLSPRTYYGSSSLEPLLIGETALYVEASGDVVRDYQLNAQTQPPGDLTILCRDLFEDRTIVSWCFCRAPLSVVWVVLDNGALLSMTYMPEHDIWGWSRQEIAGVDVQVKQATKVREGAYDVPYFVVQRTVSGARVSYTERLAYRDTSDVKKAYHLDGGRRYVEASPVDAVDGLHHLKGQDVAALVDGDVVTGLTVDGAGRVQLGATGSYASVGMAYEALVQTLPVVLETRELGSTEGRFKSVAEIAVKMKKSRGVEVGTDLSRMADLAEWDVSMIGGPIPLSTSTQLYGVSADWVRDATTFVRQRHPLPMTVTGLSPEWELGE